MDGTSMEIRYYSWPRLSPFSSKPISMQNGTMANAFLAFLFCFVFLISSFSLIKLTASAHKIKKQLCGFWVQPVIYWAVVHYVAVFRIDHRARDAGPLAGCGYCELPLRMGSQFYITCLTRSANCGHFPTCCRTRDPFGCAVYRNRCGKVMLLWLLWLGCVIARPKYGSYGLIDRSSFADVRLWTNEI